MINSALFCFSTALIFRIPYLPDSTAIAPNDQKRGGDCLTIEVQTTDERAGVDIRWKGCFGKADSREGVVVPKFNTTYVRTALWDYMTGGTLFIIRIRDQAAEIPRDEGRPETVLKSC